MMCISLSSNPFTSVQLVLIPSCLVYSLIYSIFPTRSAGETVDAPSTPIRASHRTCRRWSCSTSPKGKCATPWYGVTHTQ